MREKKEKNRTTAIILTGGSGIRVRSASLPKQFLRLRGKPLFVWCLETYDKIKEIDEIYLVINKRFEQMYSKILGKHPFKKLKEIVPGGKYRQDSIKNALRLIKHDGFVVIQNGVSPLTSSRLIKKCLKTAMKRKIVSAFIPAQNTYFVKNRHRIDAVLERENVGFTCDPQVYKISLIKKALRLPEAKKRTDVPTVALLKKNGQDVFLVESDTNNPKVTTDIDVKILNGLLTRQS